MPGVRLLSIRGIPVWVSPFFLLLGGYLVWREGFAEGALLTLCLAVSVLAHEMGHALVAARYRLSPQIVLHGLGGLCMHERADRDRHDALILVAGPLAGLALGFLVLGVEIGLRAARIDPGPAGDLFFPAMLYINLGWSVVNLLPMWPLDGGQLFRLGLLQVLPPLWAERVAHAVGILLLSGCAIFGFQIGFRIAGFIALFFIYQNVRVLLGETSGGVVRSRNPRAKAMLADVENAFAARDDEQVVRLAHALRAETNLPEAVVRRSFALLGVSTARLGRHEEALSYLRRAPASRETVEALVECLHMLDRERELDELLESRAFATLPAERRREILAVVRPLERAT